jgi:enoyl-CoA hydratase/carnithine racemase
MTDELVRYSVDRGVGLITWNRPERNNAFTRQLWERYFEVLDQADADAQARVLVVTGAGKSFSVGADMDILQGGTEDDVGLDDARPMIHPLSVRKPLIAAINGACAGLGFVHALYCDVRFAAAGAKFTTAFARRGLIAEHGSSWLLPRIVGTSRALDLLLSARVVLAEEALAIGLVDRVVPREQVLDDALAYARDLAAHCAPSATAAIKRQVYDHLQADLDSAYAESVKLMIDSLRSEDFVEGVASYLEGRPPQFPPLP